MADVKRANFAFTYIGPEPRPDMLEALDAKTCEWCTDTHGFTYAFISTSIPKRISKVEHVIEEWDHAMYRLYPFVGEAKIVTFSKQQMPADHFIIKTIRDHKDRTDGSSTYKSWTSQRPYKKQRVAAAFNEPIVVQATLEEDANDLLIALMQRMINERDAQIARLESTIDNVIAASQAAFNAFIRR